MSLRRLLLSLLSLFSKRHSVKLLTLSSLLMTGALAGCGGGHSPSSSGVQTRITLDVNWGERTPALSGPSSAQSLVVTVRAVTASSSDFAWTINRESDLRAHTGHYTSAGSVKTGVTTLRAEFHALPDGGGAIVGTVNAPVTIAADGSGIGDLATTGTVATVSAEALPLLRTGSTTALTFTARTADGALIAVTPGSAFWQVMDGGANLSVTPDGQASALGEGIAHVQVTVDGKTSASQTIQTLAPITDTTHYLVFNAHRPGDTYADTVYIANEDGSNIRLLATSAQYPALSPDRTQVAYANSNGINLINTDGTNPHTIIATSPTFYSFTNPAFSRDGTQIVFDSGDVKNRQIYRARVDGTNLQNVIGGYYYPHEEPVFSPEGSRIIYDYFASGNLGIYSVSTGGSDDRKLVGIVTPSSTTFNRPQFSPDGSRLLFSEVESKSDAYVIYTAQADGSNPTPFYTLSGSSKAPQAVFTSDGKRIVYLSNNALYMVGLDGASPQPLVSATSAFDQIANPDIQ